MKLRVLGSSSSGNCYILENEEEALLIEAGLPFNRISKALAFNYEKIAGCIVSHKHGDHSKSLNKLDGLVDIYCSEDVANSQDLSYYNKVDPFEIYNIGNFEVMPFEAIHDVHCLGFFIRHTELGRLAFITDSAYADYTFKDVNHLLVECNYTSDSLEKSINSGKTPRFQKMRLIQTHMELKETMKVIEANDTDNLMNVVLLHLSARNSDEVEMMETIKGELGINAVIARPGLELDLNINPY